MPQINSIVGPAVVGSPGVAVPAAVQHVPSLQLLASPEQDVPAPLFVLPSVQVKLSHFAAPLSRHSVSVVSPHFLDSVQNVCAQQALPEGQSEAEAQAMHVACLPPLYSDHCVAQNPVFDPALPALACVQHVLASEVVHVEPAHSILDALGFNAPVYDAPLHVAANVGELELVNVLHFAAATEEAQHAILSEVVQEVPAHSIVDADAFNAPVKDPPVQIADNVGVLVVVMVVHLALVDELPPLPLPAP